MRKKLVLAAGLLVVAIALSIATYYREQGKGSPYEAATVTTTVKAYQADNFIDSFGVNIHLYDADYNTNSYSTDVYGSFVKPKLRELGVRYVREGHGSMGTGLTSFKQLAERLSELSNPTDGSSPISVNFVVTNDTTATGYPGNKCFTVKNHLFIQGGVIPSGCGNEVGQTVNARVKIASFEGPNEPDHCPSYKTACQITGTWYDKITSYKPTWIADTISAMQYLNSAITTDSLTQNIPILSPSYVHLAEFSTAQKTNADGSLTDVSSELAKLDVIKPWVNAGAFHPYCSKAQSYCISSKMAPWQTYLPGKKLTATEMGWSAATAAQTGVITEAQQARYYPRSLFTDFTAAVDANGNSTVNRSYSYELLDEQSQTDTKEKNFGIVRVDGTAKPAFTAIKNIVTLLKDPGSSFTTNSLDYSLSSSSTTVNSVLFQKRDKSFWLAAYNDVASSTDVDTNASATLQLATASDVTVYTQDSTSATATYSNTQSIPLTIPDKILLIKIVPTATVIDPPPSTTPMHVGDIDAVTSTSKNNRWKSTVTITVHDSSEVALSGATVYVTWSGGYTGSTYCTTVNGKCSVASPYNRSSSMTLTVTNVTKSGYDYQSVSNHDPDGSSNGTKITATHP